MIIDLYIDVWPGATPKDLYATATPNKKIEGYKRYRISANIPDSAFFGEIDGQLPVEKVSEVDKDEKR